MTDSSSIRNFRPEDRDAVLELRARAFEHHDADRERRRWEWQYDRNPWRDPARPEGLVLEQAGRLVGYFGLIPWRVCIDGREVTAVAGTDFCVEPELQSQALGLTLARRFLALDEFEFRFATAPVPGSLGLWKYLGADTIEGASEPCLWVCTELDTASTAPSESDGGNTADPTNDASMDIAEVATFDARFDALFEECRDRHRIQTWRSAEYLNWRHAEYPFGAPRVWTMSRADGELAGFAVVQHDADNARAYVTELLFVPGASALPLLNAVRRGASDLGVGELYVLHRAPDARELLAPAGFHVVEGHPMGFLCRGPEGGPGGEDWYLSGADGDVLFHVGS